MDVKPLTPDTWEDFLEVMGPKGGEAGCFCMFYRQTSREFEEHKGDGNRDQMREIVESGQVPGLIGYRDGRPVGWVQVGPRSWYGRLERSNVTQPLDDRPAWAITCFVIPKEHRRTGVASELVAAAVEYARSQGAELVEGYPVDPDGDAIPAFSWMGFAPMFEECGFSEVARRSDTRPFMRLELSGQSADTQQ
jgi:GNAT superfamily N-acetyltransferase